MARRDDPCDVKSDDYQAYKEIEEQIGHCTPEQAWAMYYVSTGMVREHVSKEYAARREVLQSCLHEAFGERIQVRTPEGGLALWVRFQDETDVDRLVENSLGQGVVVRSARQFSPAGLAENALRLGFASLNRDEIHQGTLRLARAMKSG